MTDTTAQRLWPGPLRRRGCGRGPVPDNRPPSGLPTPPAWPGQGGHQDRGGLSGSAFLREASGRWVFPGFSQADEGQVPMPQPLLCCDDSGVRARICPLPTHTENGDRGSFLGHVDTVTKGTGQGPLEWPSQHISTPQCPLQQASREDSRSKGHAQTWGTLSPVSSGHLSPREASLSARRYQLSYNRCRGAARRGPCLWPFPPGHVPLGKDSAPLSVSCAGGGVLLLTCSGCEAENPAQAKPSLKLSQTVHDGPVGQTAPARAFRSPASRRKPPLQADTGAFRPPCPKQAGGPRGEFPKASRRVKSSSFGRLVSLFISSALMDVCVTKVVKLLVGRSNPSHLPGMAT